MIQSEQNKLKARLKQRGFKAVAGNRFYYINTSGDIIKLKTGEYLKNTARKEYVKIDGKYLSVPKLVLHTFKKIQYRKAGHIKYIDNDKTNFHITNIKYMRIFEAKEACKVNKVELLTAIRCYFPVNKRFTIKDDTATKIYLSLIYEKRKHKIGNSVIKAAFIYEFYLKNSIATTAKTHKMSVRDCKILVNAITNKMIFSILDELKAGQLTIQAYIPRKKTNSQALKEWFEFSANLKKRLSTD